MLRDVLRLLRVFWKCRFRQAGLMGCRKQGRWQNIHLAYTAKNSTYRLFAYAAGLVYGAPIEEDAQYLNVGSATVSVMIQAGEKIVEECELKVDWLFFYRPLISLVGKVRVVAFSL